MQVNSIISSPLTEDIRLKGHQSIRFAPDGFSVLVSDASYRPVFLEQYIYEDTVQTARYAGECERVLRELDLLSFQGETVFITDSRAVTLVPKPYFREGDERSYLEKSSVIAESDTTRSRFLRDRDLYILYGVARDIESLAGNFESETRIIHAAEGLISLADQVQASDHQRGVVLAEVQNRTLDLLVIREDGIVLLNHYLLKDPSDFIYHTLNTMRQLDLDRESIPVYLSGIIHGEHELFGLLGKYVRQVKTTPYYLESLSRPQVLHFMILSEGSKCA